MGVKIGGRQLHYLRFGDNVVLITPNISQAERMPNALQEDHRPDGQCSSQRALKKDMMLDESLERAEPTGLLFHAHGKMEDLLAPARVV
ncbi:unnamed protein product [Angiostrongylus costaricensis]|uniref:Reverse transcriptase domain-containing protein n=1 Tax=Angiostrongylus costaricensis TaxID=334426 RepID=A0A0R3PZK4_ANGCS|nr:unnamed protein product [Angiostrongylus costaricensis]